MRRFLVAGAALCAFAVGGAAHAATLTQNAVGYALGGNGQTLVRMNDLNMPSVATGTPLTKATGGALRLSGIAYRPQTMEFYGYSDQDDTVYKIDVATGVGTAEVGLPNATDVETLGFDFNNQVDAARILTTSDRNLVFDPKPSPATLTPVTSLFYATGDANEGADPNVIANAYTNAVPNASSTVQFAIDSQQDALVTVANNAGVLATIGTLFFGGAALDIGTDGGFDILSLAEGDNTAIALLTATGPTFSGTGLFLLPLVADTNGRIELSLLGETSTAFGVLDGFAVQAVPVPPALPLFASALALYGVLGRRRRARRMNAW